MPRELDDLYGETVERIRRQSGDDGELGMRVLSWVTHTKRPLLVDELAHGLAVEYEDDEEAQNELDTDNLLSSRSLVDVCAGLVIIDPRSQIIRLVHYTTQEYFDKERLHLFENAEVEISRASLTYLSYDIANTIPSDDVISVAIEEFPYLTYASLFWVLHVKEIGENAHSRAVMQEALKFVNDPAKIMFSTLVLRKLLLRPRTYARVFEDIYQKRKGNVIALEAASECGLHDPNQTLEARHRYWRKKHELEDKDTVSKIEHRRRLRELWHKAFRKVRERAKDANSNIDADTDAEPDPRGLVQIQPWIVHTGSSHHSTTDTDASELSFPWEVPRVRIVEPTPPSTRSSTPIQGLRIGEYV